MTALDRAIQRIYRFRRTAASKLAQRLKGRPIAKSKWGARLLARLRRWQRPQAVSSPTVLQMEALECGAASLAIILAHYGRWVPLEKLRIECGVSRDGSKAANVLKAARNYGMVAKGFKTEPEKLRDQEPPIILHWNFNHFLVLDGFKGNKVKLNDPAAGPVTVTEEELDASFTGVVLKITPADGYQPGGDRPRLIPALARRLVGLKTAIIFVLIAGFALVLPGLVTPVYSKVFIDQVLLRGYDSWVPPMLLAMGLTAMVAGVLTWLQQAYLLRLETKMAVSSSATFFWHVLRMPMDFFAQRMTGDIASRVEANDRVAQLLSRDLATNVLGSVLIVFYALLMFRYDVRLTLIGISAVLLNVMAVKVISRKRIDANRQLLQEQGKLRGTALGGLRVIESLKAMGGESDLYQRWAGYQTKVVNIRQRLEVYTLIIGAVPPFLAALTTAIILGFGSLRVIDGVLTVGSLIAFQALMFAFMQPVQNMVNLGSKLQNAEGDMNRLDDVLNYPLDRFLVNEGAEPDPAEPAQEMVKLSGKLEIRGLTYGYSRLAPPLIEDFSLSVNPGSRVALIGGSGSGKSTVAKLVCGLYQPWAGEILFDDKPREDIPRPIMNASLASVDQSISLFEGSLRDNLTLWDPTYPLSEVIAAARDAQIHDYIAARSGGYDNPTAEGGSNWSGGQRQRLEIARALVGNPSILVLDEATSALDPSTEQAIDEALRRRGCTCLIVAHRLSTIRDADEIIVLDKGKVVQRGPHNQLKDEDGPYAQLIASH